MSTTPSPIPSTSKTAAAAAKAAALAEAEKAVSLAPRIADFRHTRVFRAENGTKGGGSNCTGKSGEDHAQ